MDIKVKETFDRSGSLFLIVIMFVFFTLHYYTYIIFTAKCIRGMILFIKINHGFTKSYQYCLYEASDQVVYKLLCF